MESHRYYSKHCGEMSINQLLKEINFSQTKMIPSHLANNLSFQKCSIVVKTFPRSAKDENQYLSPRTRTVIAPKNNDVVSFFSSKKSSKKILISTRFVLSLSSTKRIAGVYIMKRPYFHALVSLEK